MNAELQRRWFRSAAEWLACQQCFVTKDYQDVNTKIMWSPSGWTGHSLDLALELKLMVEDAQFNKAYQGYDQCGKCFARGPVAYGYDKNILPKLLEILPEGVYDLYCQQCWINCKRAPEDHGGGRTCS